MPWPDRIKEAAYTPPNGTRLTFDFEDVSTGVPLRGRGFEFPLVPGGYVQGNGPGIRQFPMRCIFWGPEHDQEAAAFDAGLQVRGTGRLEHPFYGTFDVVPLGDITRRDDLVREANQSIIEITFFETIGLVYPRTQLDAEGALRGSLSDFDTASAEQFADDVDTGDSLKRGNLKAKWNGFIDTTSGALRSAANETAETRSELQDRVDAVNRSIDVLVGQPLSLAQQTNNLIKAPARSTAAIQGRLQGYQTLATNVFNSPEGQPQNAVTPELPRRRANLINDYTAADFFAANAIAGAVRSALENAFRSKVEALQAAQFILNLFQQYIAWRDGVLGTLTIVDSGRSYQALHDAVAVGAGFLVEISFELIPERRITLDRNRTIIDLAGELYGSVDDRLDDLINNNDLSGSEILELRKGRTIVYYD